MREPAKRARPPTLEYAAAPARPKRSRWFELTGDARRPAFWTAWWGELWPALLVIALLDVLFLLGVRRRGQPLPFERRVEIAQLIVLIGVPCAAAGTALWAWAAVSVGEIFARWMMRALMVLGAIAFAAFVYVWWV